MTSVLRIKIKGFYGEIESEYANKDTYGDPVLEKHLEALLKTYNAMKENKTDDN